MADIETDATIDAAAYAANDGASSTDGASRTDKVDAGVSCTNGILDGQETDVDCGGPQCAACKNGNACAIGTDCQSSVCQNKVCQDPVTCTNGKKDGLETDIDCGGAACPACSNAKACIVANDCQEKSCVNGVCSVVATCSDGKKNGAETDVDCGGTLCSKCQAGGKCGNATDCASAVCVGGICNDAAGCADGIKNAKETDVDCGGGGDCKPCQAGLHCVTGTDCTSQLCVNAVCTAPSCSDQVKNGQETDVDCGGGSGCVPCANGQACKDAPDCLSQLCFNGLCKVQPTCTDGVKNGNETDKDCGGGKCPACVAGKTCLGPADCDSAVCKNSLCQPATCVDATVNGAETDVDCGGGACPKCAVGKVCKLAGDCAAAGAACQAASCAGGKCATGPTACKSGEYCELADKTCKTQMCSFPTMWGPTIQKLSTIQLPSESVGCDLDGDGKANNGFSKALAAIFNGPLDKGVKGGKLAVVLETAGFKSSGAEFSVAILSGGLDVTNQACDVTSEFATCKYTVHASSYDVKQASAVCPPSASFAKVKVIGGKLLGGGIKQELVFSLPLGAFWLPLKVKQAVLQGEVTGTTNWQNTKKGMICGAVSKQDLLAAIKEVPDGDLQSLGGKETVLLLVGIMNADIDFDGDGIKESSSIAIQFESVDGLVTGMTPSKL